MRQASSFKGCCGNTCKWSRFTPNIIFSTEEKLRWWYHNFRHLKLQSSSDLPQKESLEMHSLKSEDTAAVKTRIMTVTCRPKERVLSRNGLPKQRYFTCKPYLLFTLQIMIWKCRKKAKKSFPWERFFSDFWGHESHVRAARPSWLKGRFFNLNTILKFFPNRVSISLP